MAKRGPKPLGNTVELRTTISPEIDEALSLLTSISGVSKATHVRVALLRLLEDVGVVHPETSHKLRPTKAPDVQRFLNKIDQE